MAKSVTAYIGIGGNVGDVFASMKSALNLLNDHPQISVNKISKIYKTPPWGIEDQDWFLNACASVETTLTAQELLKTCLEVEVSLKRVREIRWGPRTIDLDVLVFGEENIAQDNLQVPHPRMHERAFVLMPMADIAPDLPLNGKTISQWLEEIDTTGIQKTNKALTL
jgi:2-amino-4-hydroxy-6-hydroxymethyldihydropteridine diphosphokinase